MGSRSGVLGRLAARMLQLEGENQPSAALAQPVCLAQAAQEDSSDSDVSSNDQRGCGHA